MHRSGIYSLLYKMCLQRVVGVRDLCEGTSTGQQRVVPLPRLRFTDAVVTCRAMGGIIQLATTLQQIDAQLQVFEGREGKSILRDARCKYWICLDIVFYLYSCDYLG